MHEVCIPHSIPRAWEKKEEKSDTNNERVVKNLEERNVRTKGKSPKQDLTSAKDLNIELLEGRESHYYRLDYLTNLTYSLIYGP